MKAERTYDHIMRDEVKTFAKNAESRLKIKVNPQRKSLMGILLLFIELYAAGARDSKKTLTYHQNDVTVNGSTKKVYDDGIDGNDMWKEISRFFYPPKRYKQHGPDQVLHWGQVWVFNRLSSLGGHQTARQWRPSCEHQRRCVPWARQKWSLARKIWNATSRLHNQRLSDEHYGQTAPVWAELNINGPKQHSF